MAKIENENELGEYRSDEGGKERGHCVDVGDRRLESVEVVKSLGVMISGDGRIEELVRVGLGRQQGL